jgi:hypothetical protein
MQTIYCISGLGAGEKIFSNLKLDGYKLQHIPWTQPQKKETIGAYASRMAASVKHKDAILLGVSFGGMMGIEIAKQVSLKKLFLISSIKSSDELPVWMKVSAGLKLDKVIHVQSLPFTELIGNKRLGVSTEEEKQMVREYRRTADPVYVNWAVHQVINWNNKWYPDYTVHIHGDSDSIFPIKNIKANYIVKGGTHLMIFNKAKKISDLILNEI